MLKYKEAYEPSVGLLSSKEEPPLPYLEAVVIFNLAVYLCHTYLDIRQLRVSPSDILNSPHVHRHVLKHTFPTRLLA